MELPEIHNLIATHLSSHDKVQCILVSKTWHQWFLPSLWRCIKIQVRKLPYRPNDLLCSSESQFSTMLLNHLVTLDGLDSLNKHGHHIFKLQIESYPALKLFAQSTKSFRGCINLKNLSFGHRFGLNFDEPYTFDGMVIKIPNIVDDDDDDDDDRELPMESPHSGKTRPRVAYVRDLIKFLRANSKLTTLDMLALSNCMDGTEMETLGKALKDPNCGAGLESLQIVFNQSLGMGSVLNNCVDRIKDLDFTIVGEFKPLTKDCWTTKLSLEDVETFTEEQATEFFQHFPRVKELTLRCQSSIRKKREMGFLTAKGLKNSLSQSCLELRTISLFLNKDINDATIAQLLESNQGGINGWKSITIGGDVQAGLLTAAAVLRHASTLEVIDFEECSGFRSQDLVEMLITSPNLKRFQTLNEQEIPSPAELNLDMTDIINRGSQEWACKETLETFGIVISGFPRPDITKRQDGREFQSTNTLANMSIDQSRLFQQTICRRLGSLIHLKKLALGHDSRDWEYVDRWDVDTRGRSIYQDPSWQYDCLELSLDAGLNFLSGLKELQVLDVLRMSHRIGVAEVMWMSENWPSLKSIRGLAFHKERESKAVQWLRKHRPDIQIIKEISNFYDGMGTFSEGEEDKEEEKNFWNAVGAEDMVGLQRRQQ